VGEAGGECRAAAAAGLSALIASSELAYDALRYLGAAYLLFLGVRTLRSEPDRQTPLAGQSSLRRAFAEGLLVNVLNPKVALFFWPSCHSSPILPVARSPARRWCWAACSSRSREDGRHRHRR
jgi:threonine/homoserine/homoserine lactone efflux protein